MVAKNYKVFGGRRYIVFDWCATKREAVAEKKAQQKVGKSVRVTKATEGYIIWIR